jgi:hypothetical protein
MKRIIIILALALVAAVPATASASYTISQRAAQSDARIAAEDRYSGNGVSADGASCRPQGYTWSQRSYWRRYTWHRWVCSWWGSDGDDASVYGVFRITGHTGDYFGYLALNGGLRWES